MRKILVLISVFGLAACSSTPEEKTVVETTPVVQKEAPAATAETPKEMPKETMTMDSGVNMEGGFPDIEGTERKGATCKSGSDERMVSVIDTKEGPCGVVYNKHGKKRTVAYAKFDMSFCDKVHDNIVGNLTAGGFDCGGAAAASATETKEK